MSIKKMKLGELSEKYEVGSHGSATVSSGAGDLGGVSYGIYQMSSKPNGGTVIRFINSLNNPFRDKFKDLTVGTSAFSLKWKQIANEFPIEFEQLQRDFIKRTHYDPFVSKIKSETGINIDEHSFALQNVIWSVAVQHGGNNSIIYKAFQNSGLSESIEVNFDEKLIKAIYKERSKRDTSGNLAYFSHNSKAVQAGVANRFINEEKDALHLLKST